MERGDGTILWRTPVGLHKNNDVDPVPETGLVVLPGALGGIETPMAFQDGVVYAAYVDAPTTYSPSALLELDLAAGEGGVIALDASDGRVLWETHYDSMVLGATTVVNDLVLTSTFEGLIVALDRETGEEVWSVQAPVGINGWPAVAGDTIVVPAGSGAEPMLIALRLGAEGEMPAPPAASPAPDGEASPAPAEGTLTIAVRPEAPLSFDRDMLEAPAGVEVRLTFDNQTGGIAHNIAFFEGDSRDAPVLGRTEIATGPVVQELAFRTPDQPGSFLFICEVHPDTMRGTLVTS